MGHRREQVATVEMPSCGRVIENYAYYDSRLWQNECKLLSSWWEPCADGDALP